VSKLLATSKKQMHRIPLPALFSGLIPPHTFAHAVKQRIPTYHRSYQLVPLKGIESYLQIYGYTGSVNRIRTFFQFQTKRDTITPCLLWTRVCLDNFTIEEQILKDEYCVRMRHGPTGILHEWTVGPTDVTWHLAPLPLRNAYRLITNQIQSWRG
jgi:hypothetical protein